MTGSRVADLNFRVDGHCRLQAPKTTALNERSSSTTAIEATQTAGPYPRSPSRRSSTQAVTQILPKAPHRATHPPLTLRGGGKCGWGFPFAPPLPHRFPPPPGPPFQPCAAPGRPPPGCAADGRGRADAEPPPPRCPPRCPPPNLHGLIFFFFLSRLISHNAQFCFNPHQSNYE